MSANPIPPLTRAEIIAVGSEMLAADRTDTNSLFVTARLNELGVEVAAKAVVADHLETLASVFRHALGRADLVVLTGGLGPTDDDLTRTAVAAVLGRPLDEDAGIVEAIRARFERRGLAMPDINRRQAQVVRGAIVLPNPAGTAPGMWIEEGEKVVVLLPGPPPEMRPIFEALASGLLAARAGAERIARRVVRLVGRTESHAEERLRPLYAKWARATPPVTATILAARGQVELRLTARAGDTAVAAQTPDLVAACGRLEREIGEWLVILGQTEDATR
jgi:nicotinamide-nucleotide amidase